MNINCRTFAIPVATLFSAAVIAADAYTLPALPALPVVVTAAANSMPMGDPAAFPEVNMDFAIETNGPFAPTWTSIAANVPGNGTPAWLRQAKFGIWFHYGPQANLQSGDWSAQHMYQQGADAYNFHTNYFGYPATNGYKDVIRAWSPTNYSPAGMAQLFYNAGARFVLVQGVHHDNFDNWNSRYNPWNMMNFGAKRDTMAEWTNAIHNLGMHMGVAFHHEYSWWFTQPDFLSDSSGTFAGVPYDAVTATNSAGKWWQNYDVRRLYNQDIHKYQGISTPTTGYWSPGSGIFTNDLDYCHWYATQWALRILDVVENYNPDFIYTDGNSTQPFSGSATGTGYKCDAMQRVISHFYNRTLERHGKLDTLAIVKFHGGDHVGTTFEGNYSSTIKEDQPWFAEFGIGDWFWRPGISYDTGGQIVDRLLEAISRDGAMMVNIPNRPDGSLDSGATNMLQCVGQWMAIHSEGIYGSRAWVTPTDGNFRFTVGTNGLLYAFYEGIPSGGTILTVPSLASTSSNLKAPITSVSLLGSASALSWSQTSTGLVVTLPATMPSLPSGTAIGLKIGPATAVGSAPPANVIALPGTNQIGLSWYCPSATATFSVKRSLTQGGSYTPIATNLTAMVFNDTNVSPGTLYFYVVTAVDAAGESVISSEASASLAGAPSSSWLTEDVGAVGATGSFGLTNCVFTIRGSGADIWYSADEFRYGFQALSGDCSITARVLNMQNTATWAKVGVMIRETLDASSQYVINFMTPANGTALQQRSGTGGSASSVTGNTGLAAPYWVRLVRTNDTFTSFVSPDGTNWIQSGATTVAMNTCVYAGLAVCSVNDGTLCQAQFDNVSFSFTNQSVVVTPANLVSRYSFNETSGTTAVDSVGGYNGTLQGDAAFSGSGSVTLDGISGTYVSLPPGQLSGLTAFTIDSWFSFTVPNNNVHLFSIDDGGGYGGNYLRYNVFDSTSADGFGGTNFFQNTISSYVNQVLRGGSVLPTNNTQVHVTVVYDPVNGVESIYVNGVLSSTYNGSLAALSSCPQNEFTLGKSPWSSWGDPYLKGSINEVRVYSGVLSAAKIAANDTAGPDTLPKLAGTVTLGNLNQTYDGTAKNVTATTTPTNLPVSITYSNSVYAPSANAPTNAGSYTVIGTINDTNYQGSATNTLVINNGTGTVTLGNLSQTYDGTAKSATAATTPSGLTVSITYSNSVYALSANAPTNAGSYTVIATINDTNWQGGTNGTLVINNGTGTVTLSNLIQTYDGTAKSATAATTPTNLPVSITYSNSVYAPSANAPTNAGSYTVIGTINDNNWQGGTNGTLVISKGAGTVTLGNLNQTYDGTAKNVTATTTPTNLPVSITYSNSVYAPSANAPTNAGSYMVIAAINDTNWQGSATNTLVISKSAGTVTLSNLNQTYDGTAKNVTAATTPTNLPVSITYSNSVYALSANAPTNAGSYTVIATINDTNWQGSTAATLTVNSNTLPPLIHRYSFNETSGTVAHDSIGGADGTLNGSAAFDGNGRVVLNGTSGTYVALPGNLIAGLTNVTIEAWVTNAVSPDNVALFSFDDGLQDGTGGGYLRFVLHDQSNGRNFLELAKNGGPSPLLAANPGLGGQCVHVVCVYNPSAGVALIYTNGVLEASQTVSTSLANVSSNAAALGRSPWNGDPWLNGAIDEFRIYAGQLLPADITAAQTVGPDVPLTTNVSLAVSQGNGSLTLNWPVAGSGFTLVSSSALGAGAVWNPVNITPSVIGGNNQVPVSMTNATMFFRLQR